MYSQIPPHEKEKLITKFCQFFVILFLYSHLFLILPSCLGFSHFRSGVFCFQYFAFLLSCEQLSVLFYKSHSVTQNPHGTLSFTRECINLCGQHSRPSCTIYFKRVSVPQTECIVTGDRQALSLVPNPLFLPSFSISRYGIPHNVSCVCLLGSEHVFRLLGFACAPSLVWYVLTPPCLSEPYASQLLRSLPVEHALAGTLYGPLLLVCYIALSYCSFSLF